MKITGFFFIYFFFHHQIGRYSSRAFAKHRSRLEQHENTRTQCTQGAGRRVDETLGVFTRRNARDNRKTRRRRLRTGYRFRRRKSHTRS